MKPQDLIFLILLIGLLFKKMPDWFVWAGIISLMLSIPLFSFWVFFTAQRLVYYAAVFFLISVVTYLLKERARS